MGHWECCEAWHLPRAPLQDWMNDWSGDWLFDWPIFWGLCPAGEPWGVLWSVILDPEFHSGRRQSPNNLWASPTCQLWLTAALIWNKTLLKERSCFNSVRGWGGGQRTKPAISDQEVNLLIREWVNEPQITGEYNTIKNAGWVPCHTRKCHGESLVV